MNQRIPLDHLTSDQLDHLYERAEQAEAALTRVQHVSALTHAGAPWTANRTDTAARIRAAIAGPGTATAEETVPRALFDENARRHQAAVDRVDELLAAIERVRKVATAIRDATAAGRNDWQIGQHDCALTILAALTEPAPAATEATRPLVDRPFRSHRTQTTEA